MGTGVAKVCTNRELLCLRFCKSSHLLDLRSGGKDMKLSGMYPRSFGEYIAGAHEPVLKECPPTLTLGKTMGYWKFEEADMWSLEASCKGSVFPKVCAKPFYQWCTGLFGIVVDMYL